MEARPFCFTQSSSWCSGYCGTLVSLTDCQWWFDFFFWRQGASSDDREDCYGRATVALARAIRHTYIVSPLDMAGMIGMAQTLVVYHYGYHTLKARQILFFGPSPLPFGGSTVLETYSSTTSRSLPRTRGESIRG